MYFDAVVVFVTSHFYSDWLRPYCGGSVLQSRESKAFSSVNMQMKLAFHIPLPLCTVDKLSDFVLKIFKNMIASLSRILA